MRNTILQDNHKYSHKRYIVILSRVQRIKIYLIFFLDCEPTASKVHDLH